MKAVSLIAILVTLAGSAWAIGLPAEIGFLKPVTGGGSSTCEFQVPSGERQIPSGEVQIGC